MSQTIPLNAPLQTPTPWALEDLPPFPRVAIRLVRLLSTEDVKISEVGQFIAAEPVFSARVLQMANSPLFGLGQQVKTIARGIVVLGLERVKAITMTRGLGDFISPALKNKALAQCWRNSLAGALLAEELAPPCGMDPGFAYTAALLRDIGRLALLVKYPESYANVLAVSQEHSMDLMTIERDLFDIDHCQAGAWLVRQMGLPEELDEVVAWHHERLDQNPFRMVHLVRIADLMADAIGFPVLQAPPQRTFEEVLQELPSPVRANFDRKSEELEQKIGERIRTWS